LSPRDSGRGAKARKADPRWTLVACILASSLSFVDGSVLNVALPAIGRSFAAGAADVQWVINAFLLPLSALLPIGGAAGDLYGRRLAAAAKLWLPLSTARCSPAGRRRSPRGSSPG
jgi:MFS family permease